MVIRNGLTIVSLILAGCAAHTDEDSAASVPIPAVKPADPGAAARLRLRRPVPRPPAAAPVVPVAAEGALPPVAAAPRADPAPPAVTPAAPAPPQAAPTVRPENLVGMDEDGVRHLLGPPEGSDDQPPGRTWRYARGSCTLKVFFFMDMTEQRFRALSYQLTSSEGSTNVDQSCLAQLVAETSAERPFDGSAGHD